MYFPSKCIYFIYFIFTEITCTRMSLNLTEGIHVMKNSHSYNFQEIVTMSCKVGFTGTTVTSQCTDANTWSQKTPICTSKVLYIHQTSGLGNEAPLLISFAFFRYAKY